MTSDQIYNIRTGIVLRRTGWATQAEFAAMLGVSPAAVRAWEQGRRQPNGAALKLLHLIRDCPDQILPLLGA